MDVILPKLGLTMTEAEVGEWHCRVGDVVATGDVLVDIQMDKADVQVEAPSSGTVSAILADTGDVVTLGTVIAVIDDQSGERDGSQAPVDRPHIDINETSSSPPGAVAAPTAPLTSDVSVTNRTTDTRVFSSPRARTLARERNIDLLTLTGSGPGGRIVSRDVETAANSVVSPRPESTGSSEPSAAALPSPTSSYRQQSRASRHIVLSPAAMELPSGQWLALWTTAATAAVRVSGVVQASPGALLLSIISGRELQRRTVVAAIDDLNVEGVARRLSEPADRTAADAHDPSSTPDLLVVDLRDSEFEELELGGDEAAVTVVVGCPGDRTRWRHGDLGCVLLTERAVKVQVIIDASLGAIALARCLHLLSHSVESALKVLLACAD